MRVGRGQCPFAVLKWYENVCVCLRACVFVDGMHYVGIST